jgi:hypothetical protein
MAVQTTIIGLSVSMPLIATLFVGLRIYTRRRMKLDPARTTTSPSQPWCALFLPSFNLTSANLHTPAPY